MPEESRQLPLSELQWLSDQHEARYRERAELVSSLGLSPGQDVLDAGCGPGFWTSLIAEHISPGGTVTGVDADSTLLAKARERKAASGDVAISFVHADIGELPFDASSFDLSFCSNCLGYLKDPHVALAEISRVTKPGGTIVGKCWDAAATVFHPVSMTLATRVLSGLAEALESAPPEPYFDNYFGRQMHDLFLSADLADVTTSTIASQIEGPLPPSAERWLGMKGKWIGEAASGFISEPDYKAWKSLFDKDNENYILCKPGFYFCTIEVVSRGIVRY